MDLKGKCLIARPSITDPLFRKTVVLIYEQFPEYTTGLILNKRTPSLEVKDILSNRGYDSVESDPIYIGGPVNQKAISLLHSSNWYSSNTMPVNDQINISSDDLMMFKFVNGDVPDNFRFFLGNSVWHSQQLIGEIDNNYWLVNSLDIDDIFNYDGREMWDLAIETTARDVMDKFF